MLRRKNYIFNINRVIIKIIIIIKNVFRVYYYIILYLHVITIIKYYVLYRSDYRLSLSLSSTGTGCVCVSDGETVGKTIIIVYLNIRIISIIICILLSDWVTRTRTNPFSPRCDSKIKKEGNFLVDPFRSERITRDERISV